MCPLLFRALGILSDCSDKRNLVLSEGTGNGCMQKPSHFLPCHCRMGTRKPARPSFMHNPVPGRGVQGGRAGASAHLKPVAECWASLLPHQVSRLVVCAIIPQKPHWVSTEAPAFFSEFYLLISPWVTQPCQDLFPSHYLASILLMALFLMILKQRDDGGR